MTETNTKPNNDAKPQQKENEREASEDTASFHPVQATGASNEILPQQEKASDENGDKMKELLRSLNEESAELSGYLATENKLLVEVCTSLTQIMKRLGVSFKIPPQSLPVQGKVKKAVLDDKGRLRLFLEKEEHSAFLAEYQPETVMAVLWTVMPELTVAATSHKKRMKTRIGFLEALKNELKNAVKTIIGSTPEKRDQVEKQNVNSAQPKTSTAEKQS